MQSLELKSLVRGRVLLPGADGYDAERAGWNLTVEHHPAVIVAAAYEEDVAAAVRFAADAGLPVAVQATGHGPSVPADGAVLISTRRMNDLEVDPAAATKEVLGGWVAWTASQPEGMCSSLALWRFPDLPGVPDPMRGKFLIHVRVAYTGWPAEGERLLRALGPIIDTVADIPYTRIGEIHNDPTDPVPVRDRGTLLRELDDAAVDRIAALAGPDAELPPGMVELRHLGGALGRQPETPNAIGHRDAPFSLVLGMVALPGQAERVDGIQQALIDGLRSWDKGAALPNFLGGDTQPHQVRSAYRDADYERLAAIKAAYDPQNLFRVNLNIRPAS
jgi:hypothetical protein